MVALFKLVFPLIRKYSRLFISMVLTSALGIGLVVGLWGVYSNLEDNLNSYEENYGYPDIVLTTSVARNSLSSLDKVSGIEDVETRYYFDVSLPLSSHTVTGRVFTYDEDNDFEKFYIRESNENPEYTNIRMDYTFAEENNISAGDILKLYYYNLEYEVCVGELVSKVETISVKQNRYIWAESSDFGYMYMDKKDYTVAAKGFFNQILIKTDGTRSNEDILNDLLDVLPSSIRVMDSYTYESSMVSQSKDLNLKALKGLMVVVPPLFFTITMLIVFLFMVQILNQERRNIGIFKALGYENKNIIPLYLFIGGLIGVSACILGLPVAYLITYYISKIYMASFSLPPFLPHPDWMAFLWASLLNIAVCVLASFLGISRVIRVEPKEAMAAQGSSMRNSKLVSKLHVPLSVKITLSQMLRNWKRFLFSAICMASSVMLILASLYFYQSGVRVKKQITERMNYDALVYYTENVSSKTEKKYMENENILSYEIIDIASISITSSTISKSVILFGIPDTEMIRIPDYDGRGVLELSSSGIILDKKTASLLGVSDGDFIKIGDKEVEVTGISRQYTSSLCYMDKTYLEDLNLTSYGGILCRVKDKNTLMDFASKTPSYQSLEMSDNVYKYLDTCFDRVYIGVYILISFSLITGFIIIFNISQINLKECERETAIMKSLGVRQSYISLSWLSDSLAEFILALLIGIPVGNVMSRMVLKNMGSSGWEYPFYFSGVLGVYTALLSVSFVAVSHVVSMSMIRKWNLADLTRSKE